MNFFDTKSSSQFNCVFKHSSDRYAAEHDDISDYDDDGNPRNVAAAVKLYHQDVESRTLFCPKYSYSSPVDSQM